MLRKNGVPDLPIWSTEGSWGPVNKFCTTDSGYASRIRRPVSHSPCGQQE